MHIYAALMNKSDRQTFPLCLIRIQITSNKRQTANTMRLFTGCTHTILHDMKKHQQVQKRKLHRIKYHFEEPMTSVLPKQQKVQMLAKLNTFVSMSL